MNSALPLFIAGFSSALRSYSLRSLFATLINGTGARVAQNRHFGTIYPAIGSHTFEKVIFKSCAKSEDMRTRGRRLEKTSSVRCLTTSGSPLKPPSSSLSSSTTNTECAASRSVVRVYGKDSSVFLQSLITNDIHLLDATGEGGPCSIYAMMLNTQGRVMYDVIIYKNDSDSYLVDVDAFLLPKFLTHLKMYKLRKSVVVEDLSGRFRVFVRYDIARKELSAQSVEGKGSLEFLDPRLRSLGTRCFVENSDSGVIESSNVEEMDYRVYRYGLGVAEGSKELPYGECFPLESNLDYLAGVHFYKGCYLGQELTARTYHTGVVRKRIMPVVFNGAGNVKIKEGTVITCGNGGKTVGKLRAHVGDHGIAVMRISEALAAGDLQIIHDGNVFKLNVTKPEWWPDPD